MVGKRNWLRADVFQPSCCELGESPLWHAERQTSFWVDIERNTFYEYHPGRNTRQSWQLDGPVSLIVSGSGDEVFLGMQDGIRRFNLCSGNQALVSDLNRSWENHRCNDGKCDRMGRLWIGTTDKEHRKGAGAFYCVSQVGRVQKKIDALTISNGLAWSPDNQWFYFTDSPTREIWSYHYDEKSAGISFNKVAFRIPENLGFPDGMAMDEEGMLWIALWGGFGVGRWDPFSGEMIGFVEVPAPHVSSCAFIGEDLDELMITTARKDMKEEDLIAYPQSGDVFVVKPGVRGLPCFRCSL